MLQYGAVEKTAMSLMVRIYMTAVFVLTLLLYLQTMPQTVALEDDGLFILSSYFNGVSHPPGYPLHSLLGKLATLFPIGSVAARVHAVSAVFGALTCSLLWLLAYRLTANRLAAVLAAFSLAVSQKFWSQAIIAEVYTFNTFFFIAILLLVVHARHVHDAPNSVRRSYRYLLLAAFVFGLSLANHWPLMVLVAPAYLVIAWPVLLQRPDMIFSLLLACLAGVIPPYIWMVWNSLSEPIISFTGPINSWHEFAEFVSRSRYAAVDTSTSADWNDKLGFVVYYFGSMLLQYSFIGLLLALYGLYALWRNNQLALLLALCYAFAANSLLLIMLLGFDYDSFHRSLISVYFLVSYVVIAICMAVGFARLYELFYERFAAYPQHYGLCVIACAFVAILVAGLFWRNLDLNNRSGYQWGEKYAAKVLSVLPENSMLVTGSDISLGTIGYMHLVEGVRPDIQLVYDKGLVLNTRPFDPEFVEGHQVAENLRAYVKQFPGKVFATENNYGLFSDNYWLVNGYNPSETTGGRIFLRAADFDYMMYIKNSPDKKDYWTALHREYLLRFAIPFLVEMKTRGFRIREVEVLLSEATQTVQAYIEYADYLLQRGLLDKELGGTEQALNHVARLAAMSSQVSDQARVLNFSALLHELEGRSSQAELLYRESIELWPNNDNHAFRHLADISRRTGKVREFNDYLRQFGEYLYKFHRLSD